MEIDIVSIADNIAMGTADSLRQIKDKIKVITQLKAILYMYHMLVQDIQYIYCQTDPLYVYSPLEFNCYCKTNIVYNGSTWIIKYRQVLIDDVYMYVIPARDHAIHTKRNRLLGKFRSTVFECEFCYCTMDQLRQIIAPSNHRMTSLGSFEYVSRSWSSCSNMATV